MEGLGAVAFNDGETEKASKYFKQALATLSKCEENKVAKERILTKLSDAVDSGANSEISVGSYITVRKTVCTARKLIMKFRCRTENYTNSFLVTTVSASLFVYLTHQK